MLLRGMPTLCEHKRVFFLFIETLTCALLAFNSFLQQTQFLICYYSLKDTFLLFIQTLSFCSVLINCAVPPVLRLMVRFMLWLCSHSSDVLMHISSGCGCLLSAPSLVFSFGGKMRRQPHLAGEKTCWGTRGAGCQHWSGTGLILLLPGQWTEL